MSTLELFNRTIQLRGIDNRREDRELRVAGEDGGEMFVREATNINIDAGGIKLRGGKALVSNSRFRDVWQSPLHGDVFGVSGGEWGIINPDTWSLTSLFTVGTSKVWHTLHNNLVYMAYDGGLFVYNGTGLKHVAEIFDEDVHDRMTDGRDEKYLDPMPSGKYLCSFGSMLAVASGNVLRMSEPFRPHAHSYIHGFIQFPQRITFMQPVKSGLWVGLVTKVGFVRGKNPNEMTLELSDCSPIIKNSATSINISGKADGDNAAIWLTERGYAIGTAAGEVSEPQSNNIKSLTGNSACSVVVDGRLFTSVI